MKRLLILLGVLVSLAGVRAHAAVCTTLSANPSQSALQTALTNCGNSGGGTVQLSAGTTTVTSTITLPCGVLLSGPVVPLVNGLTTPTAEITTAASIFLFQMTGGCTSGNTSGLEYIHLNGWQTFSTDGSSNNYSNILLYGNTLTNLNPTAQGGNNAIYFECCDTTSNVTIEHNSIGDNNSCAQAILTDTDGCGIQVATQCNGCVAIENNWNIKYNYFNHLGEAIHFFATSNPNTGGNPASYCNGCDFEYNLFNQIHRIGIEFQVNISGGAFIEEHNVFQNPINQQQTYGTEGYAVSNACCVWGVLDGVTSFNQSCAAAGVIPNCQTAYATTTVPAIYASSNLFIDPTNPGNIWGYEAWGTGAQYTYNMMQGYVCIGMVYAYGSDVANQNFNYNIMQGPQMANGSSCPGYAPASGTFIGQDGNNIYLNQASWITMTGNVQGATPASVTSFTPTIALSGATFTFTDSGYTNATQAIPQGNTGIWYTTDGTTPVPGTGSATYIASGGTYTATGTTTVKAVGMWGTPPQPTSYPTGYGFTPSSVVTATYTSGPPTVATPTFSPGSETTTGVVNVTITTTTLGSTIYYTTNGTTPTTSSPVYSSPVSITLTSSSSPITINALAVASGYTNSAIGSAIYTYGIPVAAAPTFTPTGEPFYPTLAVQLATTTSGATIYYTTDGSTPTTASTVYTGAINIANTTQIQAIAGGSGFTTSAVVSNTYTLNLPTLMTCYQENNGTVNQLTVGGTAQMQAWAHYSSGPDLQIPQGGADSNLSSVGAWTSDNTTILGQNYGGTQGLAVGVSSGTASSHVTVLQNGGAPKTCSEWTFTVSGGAPPTLSGATLTLQGGGTSIPLNGTGQVCANMTYTNPASTTQVCSSGVDTWGNGPGTSWASLGTGVLLSTNAGALTPVALGNATITATIGTFTPNLNITVTPRTVTNTFQLNGPSQFGGNVEFTQ